MTFPAALLSLIFSVSAPASAQSWVAADPLDALDDGNISATAVLPFQDQLQNKGFHQICDKISLHPDVGYNQGLSTSRENGSTGQMVGGEGQASRSFYRYPTGELALVDMAAGDLSLGYAKRLLPGGGPSPLSFIFTSDLQGQSVVIRPLEKNQACEGLKALLKVTDFKTVLPLSAKHFSEMRVGELWKIPVALRVGVGPSAGEYPKGAVESGAFFVSLTYGKSRSSAATLYRLSPHELRFRVRMSHVVAYDLGGQAVASPLPLLDMGKPEAVGLLRHLMPRIMASPVADLIADAMNGYLAAVVSLSLERSDSRQILLEYILDPDNAEQMGGLEKALKGDLLALAPFSAEGRALKLSSRKEVRAALETLEADNTAAIGVGPSFAAAQHLKSRTPLLSPHLRIYIPAGIDFDQRTSRVDNHIIYLDRDEGQLRSWGSSRDRSKAYLELPFVGALKRSQNQRSVQAVTAIDAKGAASPPILVYVQQDGFLKGDQDRVDRLRGQANGLVGYLGGPGAGPQVPAPQAVRAQGSYTGATILALTFDSHAVQDLLSAPPARVVSAYADSLTGPSRDVMRALVDSGRLREGGRFSDPAGLFPDGGELSRLAENLAVQATDLVKDLAQAKAAKTPEDQAQALAKLMSGQGRSHLAYEAAMKVALQLVQPQDVGGEFQTILRGRSGSADSWSRYLMNQPALEDPVLQKYSRANRRFMTPLPLGD